MQQKILTGAGMVVVGEHQVDAALFFLGEYSRWFEACLIEREPSPQSYMPRPFLHHPGCRKGARKYYLCGAESPRKASLEGYHRTRSSGPGRAGWSAVDGGPGLLPK